MPGYWTISLYEGYANPNAVGPGGIGVYGPGGSGARCVRRSLLARQGADRASGGLKPVSTTCHALARLPLGSPTPGSLDSQSNSDQGCHPARPRTTGGQMITAFSVAPSGTEDVGATVAVAVRPPGAERVAERDQRHVHQRERRVGRSDGPRQVVRSAPGRRTLPESRLSSRSITGPVLAATLFAHELAAFRVHESAGFDEHGGPLAVSLSMISPG